MAYDDSRFRSETAYHDDLDAGARASDATTVGVGAGYGSSDYQSSADFPTDFGAGESDKSTGVTSLTSSHLSSGFDSTPSGGAGRDRVAVHLLWETVLLLFAVALTFLLRDSQPKWLQGEQLRNLAVAASIIGLLAVAAGLTLRAAVANLAVGAIAYACAMFFTQNADDRGLPATTALTLAIAAGIGAALAVIVIGFHVPAWAATLGGALAIMVWLDRADTVKLASGVYQPSQDGLYVFLGVAVFAVIGGLLGLIRPIRRSVGRFRAVADPATRPGAAAAAIGVVALVGSSVIAGGAGILMALSARAIPQGSNGTALTGLALGAALLGGTSAFGRRGGVFGTILAVVLLVVLMRYGDAKGWDLSQLAVGSAAILAGLVVTRLIEAFGRSRDGSGDGGDGYSQTGWASSSDDADASTGSGDAWSASRSGGWTTQLPANPTDNSWGAGDRWSAR